MAAEIVIDLSATVQKQPKRKAKDTTSGKDKTSPIFIPDGDYGDEIIFVEPENYSPKKKMKLDEEKRTVIVNKSPAEKDSDISVTFAKKGIDFPHAREHCRVKKFVQIPSLMTKNTGNEEFCEKCYCFVCDDLASKCESWNKGENPHCNAYSKNALWERERRVHKRNIKKFKHVPITSLLPSKKITLEMTKSGSFCSKFSEQLQKVSDLSYDELSRNTCGCYCHRDSFSNPFGCMDCSWEHSSFNMSIHRTNCQFTFQTILTESIGSIENNLRKNKPNPAIAILDTVTSLLLGVDINSKSVVHVPEWCCSRLISLWIEAAMSKNVDREILSLAKERLRKSLQEHNSKLFLAQAKIIQDILSSLKPFDDPLVVKCLTKRHKGSSSGLKEPYEVARVRLHYLKSHQKTSEAINYILGAETDACNALGTHRLCDYADQRDELIELLIKEGRVQEALTVCRTKLSSALPINLAKNTNGISFSIHSTPLKSMTPNTFEKLFLGLVRPKTSRNATGKALSSFSEEGLRNAMTIVLPWLNHTNFGFLDSWVFLLTEISVQNKKYEYPSESVRKDVQASASTFVDEKVKKGSTCFQPEDLKPPKNIPLQVYVIEILVIVAIAKVSLHKCLQSLVKKELYWACESLLTLPQVQTTIGSSDVSYITKNVLPKIDCSTIPVEVLKKWLTNSNSVFNFYSLFDLVCHIFDAGDKKKGREGVALKKKAMILSQTLMESLLIHSYGQDRSTGMIHLKTLQEKFSSEAAKKLGITTMSTWDPLEIEFFYNPSYQALEAIKNSKGSQKKEEFLKKQEVILKFLKKNTRFLQETVIEILIKLEMYKDLLECLNGLNSVYDGYEANFTKINASLYEMKQKGDAVKTMALVEALKDYVATALVQSSFSYSFRHNRKPIPSQVSDGVKLIHSISRDICMSIIQKAIDRVIQKYLNNTVTSQKRIELGRWLTEIKAIFTSVKENKEWSTTLTGILQGPLRRKPQVVKCLQVTSNLFITRF